MNRVIYLLLGLVLSLSANTIVIKSKKQSDSQCLIDYDVSESKAIASSLSIGDRKINSTSIFAPNEHSSTAVLFLIDSSRPMKKAYVKGIKPTIIKLFSQKNPWDYWAVGQFDEKLILRGDFNQTEIKDTLKKVKITGQETELFRFSIEAIKILKEREENRKFLVLFTDGMAEDQGYIFEDVIREAKKNKVSILSFGYKKTSVAIGNLRRLSSDTGGRLWIADKHSFKFKDNDYRAFNQAINSGGQIQFNKNQFTPNQKGEVKITLTVTLENASIVESNILLPIEKLTLKKREDESSLTFWLFIIGFIMLLSLLFFFFKSKQKIEEKEVLEPIAYFETISGSNLYIYKPYSLIGALADNDIVIDGEYIGRKHASLKFQDGVFYIIDNDSTNGLFVNYKKVSSAKIVDGDTISFGQYDVIFKISS